MIAYLRGEVAFVRDSRLVLDVNGVGYELNISSRDAADLPPAGEEVKIHTYLAVSEDAVRLFGFLSEDDLHVYKMLISVSGIGPKAALGILGTLSANDLRFAVFSDDEKAITKAPGIGAKTARKLILELKDKLDLEDALSGLGGNENTSSAQAASGTDEPSLNDAVQALVSLGYSNAEALKAVRKVNPEAGMDTQEILKQALKYIGL